MARIIQKIYQHAERMPNRIALLIDGETLTYHDLLQSIKDVQFQLSKINSGDRIGIVHHSAKETVINYLAIIISGGIPCIFDRDWNKKIIQRLKEQYQININVEELDILDTYKQHPWQQDKSIKDILHIGFTSGTTGLPKAYYRDEQSWINSFEQNEQLLKGNEFVFVAPGPLSHSLSLYACVYALFTGRTFIGQNHFDITNLLKDIDKLNQDTAIFMVPTMLHQLVYHSQIPSHITSIFSSGAKLSEHIFTLLKKKCASANLIEFFGTSEASFISFNFNQEAPLNSVGKLFPNVKVKLEEIDNNGIGLLYIQSNMTFSGYLNDEKLCQRQQWIQSGDFAYIDQQQFLYLYGRVSGRLIIGGKNIYPDRIENEVLKIPQVNEAVIVKEAHDKFGDVAVMLYTSSNELKYSEVKQHLMETLDRYEIPSKMRKVPKMIYTKSGKISRFKMESLWNEGAFN